MKKLVLTIAIVLGAISVSAQEVGQFWVGGSLSVLNIKPDEGDGATAFNIAPEVGYQLSDNLGVALRLGYADFDGPSMFSVEAFARYSFLKGDIGGLFVDGGLGFNSMDLDQPDTDNVDTFYLGFRPGVYVNVTEKVKLVSTFGLVGFSKVKDGDTTIAFDLNPANGNTLSVANASLGVIFTF